jgi:uncharacterized heparinase superfamily protein
MAIRSASGQGRQMRFAMSALRRRLALRFHGGALYRWRYAGSSPERLLIAPIDLRTADPTVALDIYAGRYVFSGEGVDADGFPVFDVEPPSHEWARQLHGFAWLRHLRATDMAISRSNARSLIDEWMTSIGSRDRVAWEPDVVARRLISWIAQTPMILEGADHAFYRRFMKLLTRQIRYLRRTAYDGAPGLPRLRVMIALAVSALSIGDQQRFLKQATRWLDLELVRQILPDGGHVSRNPGAILDVLIDLLPLRQAFASRGGQPSRILVSAIDRMMPMLRFFRQGDGTFAHFNGVGDTPTDHLATVLAYDDARAAVPVQAPHAGYQRLEHGGTVIMVDTGRPPPVDYSTEAHAGCLSFEMSSGRQRLIINCGVPRPDNVGLRRLSRTTAAHSTVALNDTSSCRFLTRSWLGEWLGEAITGGPSRVDAERGTEGGATFLAMRHNGYVDRYGIVHERRIALAESGDYVEGIDSFSAPTGKLVGRQGKDVYVIRFHLHPDVRATLVEGGRTVVLELRDGETWEFSTDGPPVEIEESILFSNTRHNRRSEQLTIHGRAQQAPSVVWQMQRTVVGGRRRAAARNTEMSRG